ncbi:hypothetical protein M2346_000202 [Sphingobium xanthum]|nr:hypothetical protein [Sphingobium sp. B10D3B]MCW2400183.1 hypothetical protein [Sphingobium sp. B10D7B]MCW2407161.1 hypothetical protein [Sphingobium xanthum]
MFIGKPDKGAHFFRAGWRNGGGSFMVQPIAERIGVYIGCAVLIAGKDPLRSHDCLERAQGLGKNGIAKIWGGFDGHHSLLDERIARAEIQCKNYIMMTMRSGLL